MVPDDLAATGCVNPANPRLPAAGVLSLLGECAVLVRRRHKTRYLAVPDGTTISVGADGDWQLPPGSVLMKTMELAGKPVETRLLMRHPDGGWAGYTYEWNSAGTTATRVRGGKTKFISRPGLDLPQRGPVPAMSHRRPPVSAWASKPAS